MAQLTCNSIMPQNTSHILMIRPVAFAFNKQTAVNNAFQQSEMQSNTQQLALQEFSGLVKVLQDNGVNVLVIDDTAEPHTPDSIFPNNWFSTHEEGIMALYPMFAENRRSERRPDIAQYISDKFKLNDIIDYTSYEQDNVFLEGTGSMVLDRESRICYACISARTHKELLVKFCNNFGYELLDFHAVDANNTPVYHTNVVMSVADKFMVVCLETVKDAHERERIVQSTSKEVIEISLAQMSQFAGNMLEVVNKSGEHLMVMSETAYNCLTLQQITRIENHARIIHSDIHTIETSGGGSVRCMMAEIFLEEKK
jgi:hypothetical protein